MTNLLYGISIHFVDFFAQAAGFSIWLLPVVVKTLRLVDTNESLKISNNLCDLQELSFPEGKVARSDGRGRMGLIER